MAQLTLEKLTPYEDVCIILQQRHNVRFAGIINNQGRLIAGGFKNGVNPYELDDEKRRLLFMGLYLDYSMKKDFDNSFGDVSAITSRREKINITTIPINDKLLVLSTEPNTELDLIISDARKHLDAIKEFVN